MNTQTNNHRVSAVNVMNAGNHPLRQQGAFVRGVLLPGTAFGEDQRWDARRPQLAVHCDAPGFNQLINALHDDETMVGVVRTMNPDGPNLFCIAYENVQQGLWLCMNPATRTARILLQGMQEHQNFHIAFASNGGVFSNRQELSNSLVAKELASQQQADEADEGPFEATRYLARIAPQLQMMHTLANRDEKPRLFVMMHEVPVAQFNAVRNAVALK